MIEKFTQENGLVAANVVPICRACQVHRRGSWDAAIARVAAYLTIGHVYQTPEEA